MLLDMLKVPHLEKMHAASPWKTKEQEVTENDWNNEKNKVVATNGRYFKSVDRSRSNIALRASWKHHHNNMFKRGEGWLGAPECTRRLAILHEIIRLFCQRAIRNDRLRRLSFRTMPGWLALRKQCSWSLKTWINNRLAQQLQRQDARDRDDRIWKSYNEFMSDPILPRWSHPHPCGWIGGCVDQKPPSLQAQK